MVYGTRGTPAHGCCHDVMIVKQPSCGLHIAVQGRPTAGAIYGPAKGHHVPYGLAPGPRVSQHVLAPACTTAAEGIPSLRLPYGSALVELQPLTTCS